MQTINPDNPKKRSLIAVTIFLLRFALSIFLAFELSKEVFQEVFSQVSLISACFMLLGAANLSIKNKLLQANSSILMATGVNYLILILVVNRQLYKSANVVVK